MMPEAIPGAPGIPVCILVMMRPKHIRSGMLLKLIFYQVDALRPQLKMHGNSRKISLLHEFVWFLKGE
jgi:hypothetical protein